MSGWLRRYADDGSGSGASLIARVWRRQGVRYWRRYLVSFVLMGVMAGCVAFAAYLIRSIINVTYVSPDFGYVSVLCLTVMALFVVRGAAAYGQELVMAYAASRITAENQRLIFDKLLSENVGYFAERHSAQLVSQFNYGAASASGALNLIVLSVGRDGLAVIALAVVMIIQDPLLSLIGALSAPTAFVLARNLRGRLQKMTLFGFNAQTRLTETLHEILRGIRVVKAFGLEAHVRKRVSFGVEEVDRSERRMARLSKRSGPLMDALGGVVIGLILLYGSYRVLRLGATPGEFFSFLTAFMLAFDPAKRLARLPIDLGAHFAGLRILYEFLDSPSTEPPDEGKPDLAIGAGRIAFEHVDFFYRAGEPVLRDVSFVAEPGRLTALVGHSGSGKSTVLNLLLRLFESTGGTILIDGQDIRSVSRASLRRHVAYVGQDLFLFRGSIGENIAVGRLGASQAEIEAAAQAAYAHEFIAAFPDGYDTQVGEHGLQLSAGQRQRVAIARALLRDAPIILLDEPTAALDSISEREVNRAMEKLCAGRTTLVVAHRLHTIMDADQILVLDNGAVVESGRHDDLVSRNAYYASLYSVQFEERGAAARTLPAAI